MGTIQTSLMKKCKDTTTVTKLLHIGTTIIDGTTDINTESTTEYIANIATGTTVVRNGINIMDGDSKSNIQRSDLNMIQMHILSILTTTMTLKTMVHTGGR